MIHPYDKHRLFESQSRATVEIEGYCDECGTTDYNLALGTRRARAAMDYLISSGVAPCRIKTTSFGEERPYCNDANGGCYSKNVADVLLNCAGARRRKILIVSLAVLRYCGLRGLLIGAICLTVRKFIFFCFPA